MALKIFTNQEGSQADRLGNYINRNALNAKTIKIASAYFSHRDLSNEALYGHAQIKLLIGVNATLNVQLLKELHQKSNFEIKYYFNDFHPKLYLFSSEDGESYIVGSSNYTAKGLGLSNPANLECNIASDDSETYSRLDQYFDSIWYGQRSITLTDMRLEEIESYVKALSCKQTEINEIRKQYQPSMDIGSYRAVKETEPIANYDDFLNNFTELRRIYDQYGHRLSNILPIKIEIDQMLSWVHDSYKSETKLGRLPTDERRRNTLKYIELFQQNQLKNKANQKNYILYAEENPLLHGNLLSRDSLKNLDHDTTTKICKAINAFEQRNVRRFIDDNKQAKINETIHYLLYGNDDVKVRLHEVILGQYKLKYIGDSVAMELLGWGDNEYPIWNKRVQRAMSILGFNDF